VVANPGLWTLRILVPTLLSYTWGTGAGASQVTFELTRSGNDVRLVVTHTNLSDPESMIRVAGGWYAHLAILTRVLGGAQTDALLAGAAKGRGCLPPVAQQPGSLKTKYNSPWT
jgi:hypothetical protein